MEWHYAVTVIRKMSSLDDGHLWSDMIPDELHQKKYNFDGWEAGMQGVKVMSYELFWYPKTIELATELLMLLDGMKEHTLFENCDYKLTIVPKTW